MLQLRVFGDSATVREVATRLERDGGARHAAIVPGAAEGSALLIADVTPTVADHALELIHALDVPDRDVTLLHVEAIGAGMAVEEPAAIVWADLLGQARVNARTAARYLTFMAVAGVIAAFGVIDRNQILIVGAMAIAPDLLPVTAACTGLVLRRPRLIGQGLVTLSLGLATACAIAAVVTGLLNLFGGLPTHFVVMEIGLVSQTHVSAETILVALAAGIAGMLAVETRASSGVGVAISVTTIPAAAFFGVATGVGEASNSLRALVVLGVNVAMMLAGGSLALALQRALERRFRG